jgi:hypothetical protein
VATRVAFVFIEKGEKEKREWDANIMRPRFYESIIA